ncbi:MAG TPA: hypothetical protein VE007_04735 [Thermoanaerobaculia bacterium]|nr:hypothetical protein [Thermoanaerobaculia bacterium]
MRRLAAPGAVARANRYVRPRAMLRYFAGALALGILLAGITLVAVFHRAEPLASPGPLAAPHASLDKTCRSCHSPRVATERCEQCHDPFATGRLTNAAHVWSNARDPRAAARAARLDCATCHTDHRGRRFAMAAGDDRQCRGCHFATFGSHPEFALVKAGLQKEEGLQFSHKKHLKAVRKARLDDCLYCHEPSRDRRGFVALNFEQQCSRCHLPGGFIGDTDPVAARSVVLPQDIQAPWAKIRSAVSKDTAGNAVIAKLAHKDPWVVYNQVRLASQVDPAAAAARKAGLERRLAELTSRLAEPDKPTVQAAALRPRRRTELESAIQSVREELARLAAVSSAPSVGAEGKQARLDAISAITAPCALCHVYDGGWMKPVLVPAVELARARFSHLPHVQQIACAKCHSQIEESKKAENVNLPAVALCQSCHRRGENRTDCAECHAFHPQVEPWPPI